MRVEIQNNDGDRAGMRLALTVKPSDELSITPRVIYQNRYAIDTFDSELPSYTLANLRFGLKSDRWQVAGYINNITHKYEF
jgi:outer membrane receptor protein involved in Fe transport